jgi:hypothetical protein
MLQIIQPVVFGGLLLLGMLMTHHPLSFLAVGVVFVVLVGSIVKALWLDRSERAEILEIVPQLHHHEAGTGAADDLKEKEKELPHLSRAREVSPTSLIGRPVEDSEDGKEEEVVKIMDHLHSPSRGGTRGSSSERVRKKTKTKKLFSLKESEAQSESEEMEDRYLESGGSDEDEFPIVSSSLNDGPDHEHQRYYSESGSEFGDGEREGSLESMNSVFSEHSFRSPSSLSSHGDSSVGEASCSSSSSSRDSESDSVSSSRIIVRIVEQP